MFPTNSEHLIGVSDACSAFVYGYPSFPPRAHCTPNKSVPTLRYTRRHGPKYTGHACRHLPSAVPWISEERLLIVTVRRCGTPDTWKRHRQQSLSCRILQVAVLNPRHARQVAINDSVSVVILRLWLTNETSKKQQPVSSVWGLILWLCLTHYTSKKQGWNNK